MISRQRLISVAAIFIFVMSSLFDDAGAVTDNIFRYRTPRKGWFTISPLAMTPFSSAASGFSKDGGQITVTAAACFGTGINLPNGAKITTAMIWFSNTAQLAGPQVALLRYDPATGQVNEFAHGIFEAFAGLRRTRYLTIVDEAATTVNQRFAYSFVYCFGGPEDKFLGARIGYTYTDAGD